MSVTMSKYSEGVTVHTMDSVRQGGPIFYASLPCEPRASETSTGQGMGGEEVKQRLVSTLWDHLAAMESPLWRRCQASVRSDFSIRVLRGMLGRPRLLLGERRGPAISFSTGGGRVWAALCADESDIGIDVAESDEFQGAYPIQRVFHPEELDHALSLAGGDLENASALLWSVKEAVAKALGCAFHLVDPRDITVCPSAGTAEGSGGHTFVAGLSGKGLVRFPPVSGRSLWVRSLSQGTSWLSLALVNRSPAGHE
jgi:hypothetical protein